MRVLIAVGSRHGSTREVGERIAQVLSNYDFDVDVNNMADVKNIARYDSVVLESAVYMGKWVTAARVFLERFSSELSVLPTWVFSSGPIGNPSVPVGMHQGVEEAVGITGAESGRVFAGKIDAADMNLGERRVIRMIHSPEGDFRNWKGIDTWAHEIGESLTGEVLERKIS